MRNINKNESGMALISVLGALAVITLLVGMIVAMSQTQRFTMTTSSQLSNSVYCNESALNRTIWLLLHDRSQYPDRSIKPKNELMLNKERFQSDGTTRTLVSNEYIVDVVIKDMNSGLKVSGVNPAAAFTFLNTRINQDTELQQAINPFKDKLMDYVDSDEMLRANGAERADYEALGYVPLPRNSPLQFREEILWIAESEKVININNVGYLEDICIIPPRGMQFTAGNPHFYSASLDLIKLKCDFTDREMELISELRNRIINKEATQDDVFLNYPNFYEILKKQFSFSESPFYTIIIKLADINGYPTRTLSASFRGSTAIGKTGIQFYNYIFY